MPYIVKLNYKYSGESSGMQFMQEKDAYDYISNLTWLALNPKSECHTGEATCVNIYKATDVSTFFDTDRRRFVTAGDNQRLIKSCPVQKGRVIIGATNE